MYNKTIAMLCSVLLLWSALVTSANAAVVTTRDAMALQTHEQRLSEVQSVIARADVQQAMIDMGVDPAQASLRVASLSPTELADLHSNLESAPAGGILGLIGAVFLVLLILEVTGVIDIFKKT
jgi:hypothetical protein